MPAAPGQGSPLGQRHEADVNIHESGREEDLKTDQRIRSTVLFWMLLAVSCGFLAILATSLFAWGFTAHRIINSRAVDLLPVEMRGFFVENRDYLAEHSVDPDLWRKEDESEAVRHFIDIDLYGKYPFSDLPRDYDAAVTKFGQEVVRKRGVGPWRVIEFLNELTRAMRDSNSHEILRIAAPLGHYVADLHVPLHTIENYDGQLSGNRGIHRRWESTMIDAFLPDMELKPSPASYLERPLDAIFGVVLDSYVYADDLVRADDRSKLPGRTYDKPEDYDLAYYAGLCRRTRWFTQDRLEAAISDVASFWYTAWRNAGQPPLVTD
jgi:hypothetical protein